MSCMLVALGVLFCLTGLCRLRLAGCVSPLAPRSVAGSSSADLLPPRSLTMPSLSVEVSLRSLTSCIIAKLTLLRPRWLRRGNQGGSTWSAGTFFSCTFRARTCLREHIDACGGLLLAHAPISTILQSHSLFEVYGFSDVTELVDRLHREAWLSRRNLSQCRLHSFKSHAQQLAYIPPNKT